ncbi:sigma-70 family RNA polymerase sigma factor [Caloramator sp. E03]|uniref:RNA polymerase sigma factor n=1 Tax=Caloramator sp. E03 TaxID=2576307 RepID=UPI001110B07A|nr:sigma-70 family RNA polymerase sigma factor [Caloramator sp. E03]QCX32510.1 sigma-70 family RNA polymerase sigma factor [Caloramator sp. E03]
MEERELIYRCQQNDIEAFETLILSYEKKIYNLCYYMLKNMEDAKDASQEVSLKIYRSIQKFKGESKFSTWVYRITYNTCMDYIKRRKEELSFEDILNSEGHIESKVENVIENRELQHDIKNCILRLSNDFRTIIILRDISGLSYQEIADVLGIEVGTVKSRLNRARESLRNELIKCGIVRGC